MSVSILSVLLRFVIATEAHPRVAQPRVGSAARGTGVRRFALASLFLTAVASALAAESGESKVTSSQETPKATPEVKLGATAKPAKAADFGVGLRGGFSSTDFGNKFVLGEAFVYRDLPWGWNLGKQWYLQTRLQLTAGAVEGYDDVAFDGTVGPELVLSYASFPITLDAGPSPTILSRHTFGDRNLGTEFQFTTHFGLEWRVCRHWSLSYRFQHMSNCGISENNPGLNSHLFGVVYHF